MVPFDVLYGRRCRSPIGWFEVGDSLLLLPELIYKTLEKFYLIKNRLQTTYRRQKSYADNRGRELEFKEGYKVYLKISSMKEVVRFCKKEKLSPRYLGPYEISQSVSKVSYELRLPCELYSIHNIFHVFMLKKCIGDPELILPIDGLRVKERLSFEELQFKSLIVK